MLKILQKDNKILRKKTEPVDPKKIASPKIKKIIKDMQEILESHEDGLALAAPQIGQSLRIFIISPKIFNINTNTPKKSDSKTNLVYINPKIIKQSQKKEWMEEGCLSVKNVYGQVKRSLKVTIEAYDEKGNFFIRGGSDILSQVFQHEIDHLDGILFIDKAKNLTETN